MAGKPLSHTVSVPRFAVNKDGTKVLSSGNYPVPTGVAQRPKTTFASVDPTAPNPAVDPSVGSNVIFSVGGAHTSRRPDLEGDF